MKKFVCTVCGYEHVGEAAPEKCPKCKALVGISLERKQSQLKFAAVSSQLPMPYRVVLLEEGAGA